MPRSKSQVRIGRNGVTLRFLSAIAMVCVFSVMGFFSLRTFQALPREKTISADPPMLNERSKDTVAVDIVGTAPQTVSLHPTSHSGDSPKPCVVYIRVLTREGRPVEGAEVSICSSTSSRPAGDGSSSALVEMTTGYGGEVVQQFSHPGTYMAVCRWNNLAAFERFSLNRDAVVHLDLVLKPALEVAGRTVDSLGQAISNASVSSLLAGRLVQSTTSNDEGQYHFDLPVPRGAILKAEAGGYAPAVSPPLHMSGKVDLVLTHGGLLIARVIAGKTGDPVRDVKLRIDGARGSGIASHTAVTDSLGEARIGLITPGEYAVYSDDGVYALSPPQSQVTIAAGESLMLNLIAESVASLSGKVVDGETQSGIGGVVLFAKLSDLPFYEIGTSMTDNSGAFLFAPLPAGDYTFGLMGRPLLYGQPMEHSVTDIMHVSLDWGERRDNVVFELRAGAIIRGRVLYRDGRPAPGAKVSARAPNESNPDAVHWVVETVADSDGEFAIAQAPDERDIFMSAKLRGLMSGDHGPVRTRDIRQEIVLTLKEAKLGSIAGQIVDQDGRPLMAHLRPVLSGPAGTAERFPSSTTDEEGYFYLADMPAGTYYFELGRYTNGLMQMTHTDGPVNLSPGGLQTGVRLVLGAGGLTVSGTVRRADGAIEPNLFIELDFLDGERFEFLGTTMTGDDGAFLFENLEEGSYRLRPQDSRRGRWQVMINAGESTEVVLPEPAAQGTDFSGAPSDTPNQ